MVRMQFISLLNEGELTRTSFHADGGASWTEDPPLTVNNLTPGEGIAKLTNRSTVDVEYYLPTQDQVTYYVFATETNGKVTAKGSANKEGHSCPCHVNGTAPNWQVVVNFK